MNEEDEIVRAQEFQLVDPNGQVRAAFGLNEHDSPGLDFYDADGHPRLSLGIDEQTSGVVMFGTGSDSPRLALASGPDFSFLVIADQMGAPRIHLVVDTSGGTTSQIREKFGRQRLEISVDRHGRPTIATATGSHQVNKH